MMSKTLILLFLIPVSIYCQGLDPEILSEIKSKSTASHSDAVIIIQDGEVVYEDYFGKDEKTIYIASAGKSLTNLAIGKLLDKGLLDSLDQPVHTLYPQWKQGKKKDITIRMLLNHTSGLQNHPNASIELEPPPDFKIDNVIELALAAEISDPPGTKVNYNNKAVALLGGIVQKASGKRFDSFYIEEFFEPMGIRDYKWIADRSGNPTVHGAFVIKPSDFIKFGTLILDRGVYDGKPLLSESWIENSLNQGQPFTPIWGLLWWRLPEFEKRIIDDEIWRSWQEANVEQAFLDKMLPLKGKLFETKYAFYSALEQTFGTSWSQELNESLPMGIEASKRIYGEKILAYYADGFRGNYLVIVPDKKIVAIRCADPEGFNYTTDFFQDFVPLIAKLGSDK